MPVIQTSEPILRQSIAEIFPECAGGPSSAGSTFWRHNLQCAREGLLANDLAWVPMQLSEALDMGLMWHLALERFYKARQWAQLDILGRYADHTYTSTARSALGYPDARTLVQTGRIDRMHYFQAGTVEATKAAYSVPDALQGHKDYDNDTWRGRLERMLASYIAYQRADQWEILYVEREYRTDAHVPHQGVTYTSRLDAGVRDYEVLQHPVIRNVEHKSSTFDDPKTLKAFEHDLQTWGQVWVMANALEEHWPGETFAGGLVNITTKGGKVEWSKATPRNHRVVVAPPWEGLLQWRESLMYATEDRELAKRRGYPKNWAACNRPYGLCSFFDVCMTDVSRGMVELGRPYTGYDYAAGAPIGPFFEQRPRDQLRHLPVVM